MATRARLTITVTSTATQSTVAIRSTGKYKGLITNNESANVANLPIFGTATETAFWEAVLAVAQANV